MPTTDTRRSLHIQVTGTPAPQGSKKGFPVRRANGRLGVALTESAGQPLKDWRNDVRNAALQAATTSPWWTAPTGPISVSIVFRLRRPKSHYGTGRNQHRLKPSAPEHPTTRPDLDKLTRGVHDALTSAGVITDDSQVVVNHTLKTYIHAPGDPAGADITINKLDHQENE